MARPSSLKNKEARKDCRPLEVMHKLLVVFAVLAVGTEVFGEAEVVERVTKLASPAIEVNLALTSPVIVSYRSVSTGNLLYGTPDRAGPEVIFYDAEAGEYLSSWKPGARLEYTSMSGGPTATYACRLFWKNQPAAEFELIFSVAGNRLLVTSRLLREMGSIRVTSIRLPVLTVFASQKGAKLTLPTGSGRLVDVERTVPVRKVHHVSALDPCLVGIAYHDKMLGVVWLSSLDDNIISLIGGTQKAGALYVEFVKRPQARKPELSFLVQRDSTCTVTIQEPRGDSPLDWTAGAAAIRDMIPRNVNSTYTGSFIYKIELDRPDAPEWTSFAEAVELIRRVKRLTNGAKQVAYLDGWKRPGQDDGSVNDRLGSTSQLKSLIKVAKSENAIVSVNDDYHAVYSQSPAWDPSIIERDDNGELALAGDARSGSPAYLVSPVRYVKKAADRARRTVQALGIEKTIHLAPLSGEIGRIDYNPDNAAGRHQSIAAQLAIVSEFNKLGLDVTSDVLTAPFVTRISHFWQSGSSSLRHWSAEERIPLIPMIYHGKVTAGGDAQTDSDILDLLLSGWTSSATLTKNSTDAQIKDLYYLITLPWTGLASREIAGYEKKGSVERVLYSASTYVEVDRQKKSYKIVRDGITIASDFSTMITMPDGKITVYSRDGGRISIELPEQWKDRDKITITQPAGSGLSSYKTRDGKIELKALPRVPYRIGYTDK